MYLSFLVIAKGHYIPESSPRPTTPSPSTTHVLTDRRPTEKIVYPDIKDNALPTDVKVDDIWADLENKNKEQRKLNDPSIYNDDDHYRTKVNPYGDINNQDGKLKPTINFT